MLNLATKYLSGNARPEEIQELEAWVLADPKHKQQFTDLKKAWMLSGLIQSENRVDVEKQWAQTEKLLSGNGKKESTKVVSMESRFMRYAAGLAILLVAAFLLWQYLGSDKPMIVQTTDSIQQVKLPDGTLVTLNQASSIKYETNNEQTQRLVTMIGDAYFDVERDETKPFIISAGEVQVEVLGTAFYIDSRIDEPEVQVIVEEGSVGVKVGEQEVVLTANEKAVYQKAGQTLVEQPNGDTNFKSLQTNILEFKNTKITEVVFVLNRHFNTNITIQVTDLSNCEITATFDHKSLETIIAVIEQTLGITAEKIDGNYVLSGDKCE